MLTGFIYMEAIAFSVSIEQFPFEFVAALAIPMMLTGGILGAVKATILWGTFHLTGARIGPAARVLISSVLATMFAVLVGSKLRFTSETAFLLWVALMIASGLPTALLVGSRVNPWQLFMFGRIATGHRKARSQSVVATLCTLPLRFLSIAAILLTLLWILYVRLWNHQSVIDLIFPVFYLASSVYLTFRSPAKPVLLITGLALNAPLVLVNWLAFRNSQAVYLIGRHVLEEGIFCKVFLVAWAIFLVARLSVQVKEYAPELALSSVLTRLPSQAGNHCLGSRFLDWHDRVA